MINYITIKSKIKWVKNIYSREQRELNKYLTMFENYILEKYPTSVDGDLLKTVINTQNPNLDLNVVNSTNSMTTKICKRLYKDYVKHNHPDKLENEDSFNKEEYEIVTSYYKNNNIIDMIDVIKVDFIKQDLTQDEYEFLDKLLFIYEGTIKNSNKNKLAYRLFDSNYEVRKNTINLIDMLINNKTKVNGT